MHCCCHFLSTLIYHFLCICNFCLQHQRANKDADYEFTEIDRGKQGKDLNQKEQKHLDNMGGPTNKSNPNGGTSNKKNVIKKN